MISPKLFLFLIVAVHLLSCATGKLYIKTAYSTMHPVPVSPPDYTIYALGDAGEINPQSKAVIAQIKAMTSDDTQPGSILFLGDNIYPAGLPPESDTTAYEMAENILENQFDTLLSYSGEIIFIPGNHDWNEFKPGGLDAIKRQGDFLEGRGYPRLKMIPDNGCGGPVTLELTSGVVLIIIDSQWWIHDWAKEPAINQGCSIQGREDFIGAFHQAVATYSDKQILVAMHHPLFSQGAHGGHFSWKDHIFPLTELVDWLYIPLPLIGSIYPYYRSVIGHPQDIRHRRYNSLRTALMNDLDYAGNMIFLAGHEHNLQYIFKGEEHFLISGSGAKKTEVADSEDLIFGHQAGGFMKLDFYKSEGIYLSVYEVNPGSGTLERVFSRFIVEKSLH